MDIPVVFVATLLHRGLPKDKTEKLCRKAFKADLLGGLSNVLQNVDEKLIIPLLINFNVTIRNGKPPPKFPILYFEDEKMFKARDFMIKENANFL